MQTLYLKYRSAKISELDLREVREMLTAALESKNFPHAWLFSGPRGTGKTSSARLVAKSLNCPDRKGAEPCGTCEMCVNITAGTAMDVIEIDAASNRGIEEIRELKEKVRLAPMKAIYKVYVIDEVHMLTLEAANALLKTLEEPPEKTIFVLCTTEPEKLPVTVVSRCTRILFKKPTVEEAIRSLERVVKGENLKADKKALILIAQSARGSFRDATKILEQVSVSGREITEDNVRQVLGEVLGLEGADLIDLILEGKQTEALKFVAELVSMGVTIRSFVEKCSENLRERLLHAVEKKDNNQIRVLLDLVRDFDKMFEQMKFAAVGHLPLEVLIIEKSQNKGGEDVSKVKEETEVKQEEKKVVKTTQPGVTVKPEVKPKSHMPSGEGKYSLADVENKWGEIMKLVKPKNHSVEALLRSTRPAEFDGEKLVLEVFYKFHKDKLETEKCRQIVEESTGEALGVAPVKLFLKLGQKANKPDDGVGVDEIVKAAEAIFK